MGESWMESVAFEVNLPQGYCNATANVLMSGLLSDGINTCNAPLYLDQAFDATRIL